MDSGQFIKLIEFKPIIDLLAELTGSAIEISLFSLSFKT